MTIEDIVEGIVGDIEDEHDEEASCSIVRRPDGVLEVAARVELEELEQELGISFTVPDREDDVDTLGGLTVMLADRVPETGACFVHPNGWKIEVAASDGRRVESLLLHPPSAQDMS